MKTRAAALTPLLYVTLPPLPPVLRRAYRDTAYRVTLRGGKARRDDALVLRVGQPAPELALAFPRLRCWALLTAWNPESTRRGKNDNCRAQSRLRAALRQGGRRFFPGENRADPMPRHRPWPPEASLFVPNLPLAAAVTLARHFRQKAALACSNARLRRGQRFRGQGDCVIHSRC
ncbi:MAG: DUF3293 domain-containing protein [Zoogloeaceae bacterium]|jgi:hypothetical protein|nr:DUF3293 domain-containing protein [Zoogloeaceae bacterium]